MSRSRAGLVLGPVAFVACGLALGAAHLTVAQAWTAATVLLMAIWWITETAPLWATALLPLAVFPVIGAAPLQELGVQYFDRVNFLFLGGMLIAAAMEQHGLHRRMALGIVSAIGTSPRQIVLGFMVATGFITLWISNTAAALMMFPIGMAVLERFEAQRGRQDPLLKTFGLALMLGIGYAASMGGIGTKIGTGVNFVFVKQAAKILEEEIGFVTWSTIAMPIVIIVIPLAWMYLVRRLPREEFPGGRATIDDARRQLGPMKRGEKVALVAFLTAAVLWVFGPRGKEPEVAMGVALALMLIPRLGLHWRSAVGISWGLLVLLGGGFAMAHGIERSGLSTLIGASLQQLGGAGPYLSLVVCCLVTIAVSEVASNTATASILLPLLGPAAPTFGLHPATLMFAVTLSASFGFMLPAGTPPNAIVFSSGYIPVTTMARSGVVIDIGGGLVIATICYFIAPWALGVSR